MSIIRTIIWMNFLLGQGPEAEGQWGHGGGTQAGVGMCWGSSPASSWVIIWVQLNLVSCFCWAKRKKKKPQTARGQADNAFIYRFSAIFSHFHSAATLIPAQSINCINGLYQLPGCSSWTHGLDQGLALAFGSWFLRDLSQPEFSPFSSILSFLTASILQVLWTTHLALEQQKNLRS